MNQACHTTKKWLKRKQPRIELMRLLRTKENQQSQLERLQSHLKTPRKNRRKLMKPPKKKSLKPRNLARTQFPRTQSPPNSSELPL